MENCNWVKGDTAIWKGYFKTIRSAGKGIVEMSRKTNRKIEKT